MLHVHMRQSEKGFTASSAKKAVNGIARIIMFVLATSMGQTIFILKGEPNIRKQLFWCCQQWYAGFHDHI